MPERNAGIEMWRLRRMTGALRGFFADGDNFVDALAALIDVAEEAHRANFDVPCGVCKGDDWGDCANERLQAALDRFDFSTDPEAST